VIARTIIERHHGTIAITEHCGPGTTFCIQLPAAQHVASHHPSGDCPFTG